MSNFFIRFLESIGLYRPAKTNYTLPQSQAQPKSITDAMFYDKPTSLELPTSKPTMTAIPATATAPAPAPAPAPAKSITEVLHKISDSEDRAKLAKFKIAIIVGHDAMRPGAIFQTGPLRGTPEYQYWKQNATIIKSELTKRGFLDDNVQIIFRDRIGISGAYNKANNFKSHFVIELHFNSSADSRATGFEVLIGNNSPSGVERCERAFIESMRKNMLGTFGSRIRHGNGVMEVRREDRGGGNVCALPNTPCVLIEPFFASNVNEAQTFARDENRQELSRFIAIAAMDALLI